MWLIKLTHEDVASFAFPRPHLLRLIKLSINLSVFAATVEALQMLDGMIINVVDKSRIGVKLGGGSVVMRYKISLRKRKD
jgi:hypothetical protein